MERVLADDFSGAAEVAGVAFRYGFSAAVHLDSRAGLAREFTVLDLDSRSKSSTEAVRLVRSVIDQDGFVFKKIDSVLRGHVLAETGPFLQSGRYRRALVVPFNPDLGRTIVDGVYRIQGRPISQTSFRDDPEYPALTSNVATMLGPAGGVVRVCRLSDALPETGIVIGQGETHEELRGWAGRVDETTLPVGGAPFLAAWLESRGSRATPRRYEEGGPRRLVVSGTASQVVDWERARDGGEVRVLPMPDELFQGGSAEAAADWAEKVVLALEETGFAVASIGGQRFLGRSQSPRLLGHLADLGGRVLARCRVDQLWLEGGATASAVMRTLGWASLEVVGELAPGVVQLRSAVGGPLVTVKPGSYPLPALDGPRQSVGRVRTTHCF